MSPQAHTISFFPLTLCLSGRGLFLHLCYTHVGSQEAYLDIVVVPLLLPRGPVGPDVRYGSVSLEDGCKCKAHQERTHHIPQKTRLPSWWALPMDVEHV